ncbi:predicted protein [Nematostella vectensis]|uniref:Fibrinogen C-terminal domain-containing protein n=1 Tax=Nematostella vectensis TaxID=45351 RepID=A7RF71_NEMVE|nr:predicted protein [Nematostella vectensis]|eukprot:XP_001641968.1 predicted protein [Nematostella vectensis]
MSLLQKLPSCAEIQSANGAYISGIYKIALTPSRRLDVYCDLSTSGGGWTVIQKRMDGSVDFYRSWDEYKMGFGDKNGEFWLGLDNIHAMTSQRGYRVRFDLEDFEGNTRYAEYDDFRVGDETTKYKLVSVGTYSGTAGDSFSSHRGFPFTTRDRDNDNDNTYGNCAERYEGAWWYDNCYNSNLNGKWTISEHGITWEAWRQYKALRKAEIKIRPY